MKIENLNADQTLDRIILYLTPEEARMLYDALRALLRRGNQTHSHLLSPDFQKEISISLVPPG